MKEKISFQFLAMKAEASGLKSVRTIAFLCSLGLLTLFGIFAMFIFQG